MRRRAALATAAIATVVFSVAGLVGVSRVARAGGEVESKWPPTGPTWETDPTRAFERARKESKGVFVYVATDG